MTDRYRVVMAERGPAVNPRHGSGVCVVASGPPPAWQRARALSSSPPEITLSQVDTIIGVFVDGEGRKLEVIALDRGHGPQPMIRATWRGYLLADGYYDTVEDALALVDVDTLVEVIPLPANEPCG